MKSLITTAAATALLYASTASASQIAAGSELSLNGSDQFTPTSITFVGGANIGGASGSFSVLGAFPPECLNCATMTSFNTTTANFELYTATDNGATTTLTTMGLPTFDFTPGSPLESLAISGTGILSLAGFDNTAGTYEITTQGPTGDEAAVVTFSSTAVAVPTGVREPNALSLLGMALGILGLLRFRSRRLTVAG